MKIKFPVEEMFQLHYEGDDGGDSGDPQGDPPAKTFTQDDVDSIVSKKTEEVRRKQKQTLKKFEEIQATLKMSDEQRSEMEAELEELRGKTLTAEEIAKREAAKASEKYEQDLNQAREQAQTWEQRHNQLKVNYEITSAAQSHGVIPESVPFLEAFLQPKTKIVPVEEEGQVVGYQTMVAFEDQTADGKPLPVELSVSETVKRMKETPEKYGQLFASESNGGLGGSGGRAKSQGKINWSNMTADQVAKLRKENPEAFYGK